MTMNRYLLSVLTSAALLVPAGHALAAPGDLDTSFSGDGRELINFGAEDFGEDVLIQPDGKVVVAGHSLLGGTTDFVVTRLNADGSPDNTFSGDGRIQFGYETGGRSTDDRVAGVALAPDGRIVVAGVTDANAENGSGKDMAVARLTSGGAIDTTFNAGKGKQTIDYGQDDRAADVEVRGDGAVIVGGTALIGSDTDFAVARLTSSGLPDTSWSDDGRASAHFGAAERLNAIALTADGGVVATGHFQAVSSATDSAIARYLPNGKLDEQNFAGRGKLLLSLAGKDSGADIAVQPDGKLVIAAAVIGSPANSSLVTRLTPTGGKDAGFGDDGVATAPLPTTNIADAMALTSAGRIVIVGQAAGGQSANTVYLVEFDSGGQPDRAFSDDGALLVDFPQADLPSGVAVRGDRAVIVGIGLIRDVPVAAIKIHEPEPAAQSQPAAEQAAPEPPQQQPEQGQPQSPPPAPTPSADTIAPLLSQLKLTGSGGTEKVAFRISEQATVKATVQRKVKRGRRTRLVAARTITLKGKAGTNAFKVKRLKPGRYRVTVKATDAAGNASKALRKSFVLKKSR
jgi:uncharacterized delta-60 repeat protein